jgi:hypothetical protein
MKQTIFLLPMSIKEQLTLLSRNILKIKQDINNL